MKRSCTAVVALILALAASPGRGQQTSAPIVDTLPDGPQVFDGSSRGPGGSAIPGPKFRVVPLKGLSHPYGLVFLPDGSMLITERAGRLRIVRNGVLDPEPIAGIPPVFNRRMKGLNDVALHPGFAQNGWVYFTYYRPSPGETDAGGGDARPRPFRRRTPADRGARHFHDRHPRQRRVRRAHRVRPRRQDLHGHRRADSQPRRPGLATPKDAQDPGSHFGKVLRLNDDGTAPSDNPFAGRPGYKPEIYALGIRNAMALIVHPGTGEIWETENGPQGGDELNIIKAGRNYGWPVISYGRSLRGESHRRLGSKLGTARRRRHGAADAGLVTFAGPLRHGGLYGRPISRLEGECLRRCPRRRAAPTHRLQLERVAHPAGPRCSTS